MVHEPAIGAEVIDVVVIDLEAGGGEVCAFLQAIAVVEVPRVERSSVEIVRFGFHSLFDPLVSFVVATHGDKHPRSANLSYIESVSFGKIYLQG